MTSEFAGRTAREAALLDRDRLSWSGGGTQFSRATVAVDEVRVAVDGEATVLSLREFTQLYFTHPGSPETSTTSHRLRHVFTFQRFGGAWQLTGDALDMPSTMPDPITYVGALKLGAPSPRDLKSEPPLPVAFETGNPEGDTYGAEVGAREVVNFDRVKAWRYMREHVFEYNQYYERFGNDCANFISQALREGGWQDIGHGDDEDPNNWYQYYIRDILPVHSKTWSVSQFLADFGARAHRFRPFTPGYPVREGDVVFADWENGIDGHLDHTMMVTENVVWGSSNNPSNYGNIRLSYHTNDVWNEPLNVILDRASNHGSIPVKFHFVNPGGYM
ncbi:amidase domain-containing protein [Amycolatopsis sp. NPDC059657]|uniref:amidase domain-containing protein n=1 Tax=Amycolatopsis sp. NPDC059657 TaxID=3346899 RepID=UPI00366BACC1